MKDLNEYNVYPSYRIGQREAIQGILDTYEKIRNKEIISKVAELASPTGSGKCFEKNTEVVMYDGSIKKVQDIKTGDTLIGPDSLPRQVLNLSYGVGPLYKITPIRGGEAFTCNGNHILNLIRTNDGTNQAGKTVNISINEYITKSKTFKHIYKLWHTNAIKFEPNIKNLPIPPYLLGIWIGDGTNGLPEITNPENEIKEYIFKYAKTNNLHVRIEHQNIEKTQCPTFYISNDQQKGKGSVFSNFIKDLKTQYSTKRIPIEYLTSSIENRLELLAGLLDSDGYYHEKGYELIVKDNKLSKDIAFLARSLGISVTTSIKTGTIKKINFTGIYNQLYLSGNLLITVPCKVNRKKAILRTQIKNTNVTGFSVEFDKIDEYYGFEVSGDHLFMLNDFTVTHNSLMLTVTGNAMLDAYPEITKVTYTTPLRNLVQQIRDDLKLKLPVVMGRSNYPCAVFEGLDASDCPYRSAILMKRRPVKCRRCEYMQAKNTFKGSKFGVCTLDFYMYNRIETDVLIVDESSGLEDKLLEHFAISLPGHIQLDNLVNSIHDWMISLQDEEMALEESLEGMNFESTRASLQRDIQNITRKLNKTTRLVSKCGRILKMAKDPNDYFIDKERNFKLLHGAYPFNQMASKVKFVIMSSGTPTTSLLTKNFTRIEAPHPIPVSRRKIYYTPVGKMSRDNQDKTIPLMAERIMEIHRACPKNTLVHAHSFGLAEKFRPYMKHQSVLIQESGLREEALNKFLSSKECIWFSVAYAQGLNLDKDQFQRNIIAKVPYPGLGEWVVKRNESDIAKIGMDMWYRMTTAVDIQQASGRCTRGPQDYSETYILDANFGYFFNQNKQFFEQWFKDALVWIKNDKKPVKSRCKV